MRSGGFVSALVVLAGTGWLTELEAEESGTPGDSPRDRSGPTQDVAGKAAAAKGKTSAGSKGIPWVSLDKGLAQVRVKYIPAVVVYEAPEKPAPLEADESAPQGEAAERGEKRKDSEKPGKSTTSESLGEVLSDVSLKRALRDFVCIRLEPGDLPGPYPPEPEQDSRRGDRRGQKTPTEAGKEPKKAGEPRTPGEGTPAGGGKAPGEGAAPVPEPGKGAEPSTVAGRLRLAPDKSSLLVLSFREEVLLRYDGETPKRSRLSKELARVAGFNRQLAAQARRAEQAIQQSRYAAGVGEKRKAVQFILPFETKEAQSRLDAVAKDQVNKLIEEYRLEAKKAMDAADKLESNRKYTEAIQAYDAVQANYPFPDILQRANVRKGEILRKMTYGF